MGILSVCTISYHSRSSQSLQHSRFIPFTLIPYQSVLSVRVTKLPLTSSVHRIFRPLYSVTRSCLPPCPSELLVFNSIASLPASCLDIALPAPPDPSSVPSHQTGNAHLLLSLPECFEDLLAFLIPCLLGSLHDGKTFLFRLFQLFSQLTDVHFQILTVFWVPLHPFGRTLKRSLLRQRRSQRSFWARRGLCHYCASFACSATRSTTTEFQHNDIMMKTTVQNDLRLESVWIVCAHEKSNN